MFTHPSIPVWEAQSLLPWDSCNHWWPPSVQISKPHHDSCGWSCNNRKKKNQIVVRSEFWCFDQAIQQWQAGVSGSEIQGYILHLCLAGTDKLYQLKFHWMLFMLHKIQRTLFLFLSFFLLHTGIFPRNRLQLGTRVVYVQDTQD